MMKTMLILATLSFAFTASADDCDYCARIEKVRAGFSKVKPDPMDEKTSLQQSGLVDETIDIAETVIKEKGKKMTDADIERLVSILAVATPYDNANIIGQALVEPARPYFERFRAEVKRQEAKKLISSADAEVLITDFIAADAQARGGNDRAEDADDEKPKKEEKPAAKAEKKADTKKK